MEATLQNVVSAVGGFDASADPPVYVPGDDCLACLKDVRRWLQFHDEHGNRWDVRVFLADRSFVQCDLTPILRLCYEREVPSGPRIALSCVEILVPLTWPMDMTLPSVTGDKIRQYPLLCLAQSKYKQCLLDRTVLMAIVAVAMTVVAIPRHERKSRDESIFRLVLYLLRNICEIDDGPGTRSGLVEAFHDAKVFDFLLMVASNIEHDFSDHGAVVMEIVYRLVRGTQPHILYTALDTAPFTELGNLLQREKDSAKYGSKASRHNRFGTMISLMHGPEAAAQQRLTISGQKTDTSLRVLDEAKKWRRPARSSARFDDVDRAIPVWGSAGRILVSFCDNFLDSSFNPLMSRILRDFEREDESLNASHPGYYMYLSSFFMQCLRCRAQESATNEDGTSEWGLVACAFDERALVMLNRLLRASLEGHDWPVLQSGLDCFKQILLCVQSMELSMVEEYQNIAENLQSRIYYHETTLDLLLAAVRQHTNRSLGYLDASTDLLCVFVKMLEKYASSRQYMYIRSRRHAQRHKRKLLDTYEMEQANAAALAESQTVTKERAFEFAKFQNKLVDEKIVANFIELLRHYKELSSNQIRRVIAFFYRLFVTMDSQTILYKVELLVLMNDMMRDRIGFPTQTPARKEFSEFLKYYMRKLRRALAASPLLYVEMLFDKLPGTHYFLQTGQEFAATDTAPEKARLAAALRVRADVPENLHIAVVVVAMLEQNKDDLLDWLKSDYSSATSARLAWMRDALARRDPDDESEVHVDFSVHRFHGTDSINQALVKDGKLRLLIELLGGRSDAEDGHMYIPENLSPEQMQLRLDSLRAAVDNPPAFGSTSAQDMIKYKPKITREASDSSDGEDSFTSDSEVAASGNKRKRRSKKTRSADATEKSLRRIRRKEKQLKELEQIKSAMYVIESDDEAYDEQFFQREEELRKRQAQLVESSHQKQPIAKTSIPHHISKSPIEASSESEDHEGDFESSDLDEQESSRTLESSEPDEPDLRLQTQQKPVSQGGARANNRLFYDSEEDEDTVRGDQSRPRRTILSDSE